MKPKSISRIHEPDQNRIKKGLILYIWRMQESQTIISVLFYSLSLTGIYFDRISWRFEDLGIESTTLITLILTSITFVFILFLGFGYDKLLGLWKHKNVVMMKKNVFLSTHLTPKERVFFSEMWLPIVQHIDGIEGQGTLKETITTLEHWRDTGFAYKSGEDHEKRASLRV